MLLGDGPGLYFDFATLSFQVPIAACGGWANAATANANMKLVTSSLRMENILDLPGLRTWLGVLPRLRRLLYYGPPTLELLADRRRGVDLRQRGRLLRLLLRLPLSDERLGLAEGFVERAAFLPGPPCE